MATGIHCADHATPLYPQKLALTSPTGGGCSVGIVRSRTKATEFSLFVALVKQDVKGLCCVMLSVASLALQHDFWEKVMEYKMCVLVSSTLFV